MLHLLKIFSGEMCCSVLYRLHKEVCNYFICVDTQLITAGYCWLEAAVKDVWMKVLLRISYRPHICHIQNVCPSIRTEGCVNICSHFIVLL
jgi:hypothetical protein